MPTPAPTTAPIAIAASAGRLSHELRLVDAATPTPRGCPAGVLGAEVWVRLEEPKGQRSNGQTAKVEAGGTAAGEPADGNADPSSFNFLSLTLRPTLLARFKPGEGGKTAVYMARWVNTRGEKGPWSEVASATVAA